MTSTSRVRRRLARPLLCCACAVGIGTAAAPALADDSPGARAALRTVVDRAQDAGSATPQGPERALAQPSQQRGLEAITASAVLYDAVGDGLLAPDLQQMLPFTSDDGRYSVGIVLESNGLIEGDAVVTFVNTDGNGATGEAVFGGADLAVTIVGHTGTDSVVTERWNGAGWQPAFFPSLISFWSGTTDEVWSISAAELGVAAGTPTTLQFASIYQGVYDDYFDFAPEPGAAPFTLTAGGLSAPPPTAAAPVAPAATTLAAGTGPPTRAPVAVQSFSIGTTPSGLRMRLGWVRGTGPVRWTLRLSARVNGRRVTKVIRGSGAAGSRTITRTVGLPATWRRATIAARLTVADGARVITRSRTIRS